MKQRKEGFFKRAKNAITNFDKYREYADNKLSVTIKYILKLVLIFAVIATITLTIKINNVVTNFVQVFKNECPEFKIENNNLVIEADNKEFVNKDESNFFGFVINTEKDSLDGIEEIENCQTVFAILKDKIILRNSSSMETSITYAQISEENDLSIINKQTIVEFANTKNITTIISMLALTLAIFLFIIYLAEIIIDILLLSIIGLLFSKIIGINFKYKQIFNMSVYAITLSFVLYTIYMVVNISTGFVIKYFDIAYDAISYIYIITAMMMIKTDLAKEKMEVGRIVQEQIKIREEKKEEQKEEEKKKNNKQKEKKGETKKEENGQGENPEGSNA